MKEKLIHLKMYPWFLFLFLFLIQTMALGEDNNLSSFANSEKKISLLAGKLAEVRFNDSLLYQINSELIAEIESVLSAYGSFNYAFDSLKNIGKITSDDKLIRLFTWNIVKADGTHQQFGYIQYFFKSTKEVRSCKLTDRSESIDNVNDKQLTAENWYGATYYQIVQNKGEQGPIYTLIGWDGNDLYTNKKVIDVLTFNDEGKAVFGKPIFQFGKTKVHRIIFEYSRMASMMIRWDSDYKMIIMDHLSPSRDIYQGNFKYYGPDLSYDALKYTDNIWEYIPAIDYKMKSKKKK